MDNQRRDEQAGDASGGQENGSYYAEGGINNADVSGMVGDVAASPVTVFGQGYGESTRGNTQDETSGVFYGDVGVDRDIDTTVNQLFSGDNHPLTNPVNAVSEGNIPLLDSSGTQGQPTTGITGSEASPSPRQAAMQAERDALATGNARVGQATETEEANRPERFNEAVSEPAITMTAVEDTLTYRQGAGLDATGARMLAARDRDAESVEKRNPEIRDPGSPDGYAYVKDDDSNPEPTENVARSVGMVYNPLDVAANDRDNQFALTLPSTQVGQVIGELHSVGVSDECIDRRVEGEMTFVLVETDKLTRPYVAQIMDKYRMTDSTQ